MVRRCRCPPPAHTAPAAPDAAPPEVVFLFSDIEGSTRLWEQQTTPWPMPWPGTTPWPARRWPTGRGSGSGTGDGLHAVFSDPAAALGAMLQLQRALADAGAAGSLPLALRCGLHAGPAQSRDNDWFGPAVNRAARIMAAAHGGQMLVSAVAQQLQQPCPPACSCVTWAPCG